MPERAKCQVHWGQRGWWGLRPRWRELRGSPGERQRQDLVQLPAPPPPCCGPSTTLRPLRLFPTLLLDGLWLGTGGGTGRAPTPGGKSSSGQDTSHFLPLGPDLRREGWGGAAPRGRHSSWHSNSSSTISPFPALAANFNHFLLGPPPASAAAWPCADPGRGQDGPCPASSNFGTSLALNQASCQ